MAKGFIAVTKHDSSSDGDMYHRDTYKECVDIVHEHFLGYGFEIKDGKPYDSGNDSEDGSDDDGFSVFDNVEMFEGKVAGFSHADGDGPEGEIEENQ